MPALTKLLDAKTNHYDRLMFLSAPRSDGPSLHYPWTEEQIRGNFKNLQEFGAKVRRYENTLEGAKIILDALLGVP